MPRRLAIEWDSRELRVVAGVAKGSRVTITDVVTSAIESSDPQALGETLKRLLLEAGLDRLPAGVALGRGKAELRDMRLPPVPDAELPDMVRFEAMRTFANSSERSAIDFLQTKRDADAVRVIAAAVGADALKNVALVAVPSQVVVEHLVLRPLAAASLYRNTGQPCEGEVVLVDLLADDADIVVMRDGAPVFVRSIRLADDPTTRVRVLSGEIRRSLMACQEGQGQDPDQVRRVVMWGRQDVHADEVAGLSKALATNVVTLDPFSLLDVDAALRAKMPEHVGRLAPLVGMLHAEVGGNTDLIDFLNPRRPPAPPSKRSTYIIAGAGAAAVVAAMAFMGWNKIRQLDNQIAAAQLRIDASKPQVERADTAILQTQRLDSWLDQNVVWLDELKRTAEKLPPSSQAIVQRITANSEATGGGKLIIDGGVTRSSIIAEMEASLRDEHHQVSGKGSESNQAKLAPYDDSFSESIFVSAEYVRSRRDAARLGVLDLDAETAATAAPGDTESAKKTEATATQSGSAPVDAAPASPSDLAPADNAAPPASENESVGDAPADSAVAPSEQAPSEQAPGAEDQPEVEVVAPDEIVTSDREAAETPVSVETSSNTEVETQETTENATSGQQGDVQ